MKAPAVTQILRPPEEQAADIIDMMMACIPERLDILPSQWAEERRILPAEYSPRPGRVTYDNSPYLREIVDCFSPLSPVREVAVMKPAQIGYTQMVIETAIGYIIDVFPRPILYVSADKELTEANMQTRIDAMIASANIVDKIMPTTVKKVGRRTGDTMSRKEFRGGFIAALGAKNANKFRQFGFPVVLADEVDTFEQNLGGQGSAIELIRSRTSAFSKTRKIAWGGTPLIHAESNIESLFLQGDQSYYFVKCPHCGAEQRLYFGTPDDQFGLKFERTEASELIPGTVHYLCVTGCKIAEAHKYDMLKGGRWIPTVPDRSRRFRSFMISALYSNFFSWDECVLAFLTCKGRKDKLQVFVNNVLGETWKEEIKPIDREKAARNSSRRYLPATVPNRLAVEDGSGRIVILTLAVDVNGQYNKPDGWLAVELRGHCRNGQTYSIAKGEIHGRTEPGGGAWLALKEIAERIYPADDGMEYRVNLVSVDAGFKDYAVHWFTGILPNARAVRGKSENVKNDKVLTVTHTTKGDIWWLDTVYYKNLIASNCLLEWQGPPKPQPPMFMNFPDTKHIGGFEDAEFMSRYGIEIGGRGYDNDYYKLFGAEAPIIQKDPLDEGDPGKVVGWRKRYSRAPTHFWDCLVYGFAARDIYLEILAKTAFPKIKNLDTSLLMKNLSDFVDENGAQWG